MVPALTCNILYYVTPALTCNTLYYMVPAVTCNILYFAYIKYYSIRYHSLLKLKSNFIFKYLLVLSLKGKYVLSEVANEILNIVSKMFLLKSNMNISNKMYVLNRRSFVYNVTKTNNLKFYKLTTNSLICTSEMWIIKKKNGQE